jgi:CRISPR-associated protein Csm2
MCKNYQFKVEYFENGNIKADLFSDEAEKVVKCFLEPKKNISEGDYEKRGNRYKCKDNKWREDCPKNQRKVKKTLSSTQIRKFYEEVLNLKAQLDNSKKFDEILPYFRMLKAKANVAYERDVINTNFKTFIEKNVDYVDRDENRFKIFCTFFEAVVAYAKGTIRD